jgi:hypothetical protein
MSNNIRRARRALVPLATLAAAGAVAAASGATFTASTASTGNFYASGTLTQTNSKANAAIFNASNLKPGDTVNGTVTIKNSGSLPAQYTLAETNATNGFTTASNLQLTIKDSGSGATVYSGALGSAGSISLGTWAAGDTHTYSFSVQLKLSAGNDEQGKQATAEYDWNAVQVDPVTINQ